jgi:glycosyltransferase involved in cell wall biosynthesis
MNSHRDDTETVRPWRGQLDRVDREHIEGWAQDTDEPDRPVRLRFLDNGTPIGELLADTYREDLEAASIGDGRHSFLFEVPGGLEPQRRHLVEVLRADDGRALPGSPVVVEAAASAMPAMQQALPATWQGNVDLLTRHRIEGWAFDRESPEKPVALVFLDNGEALVRTLANRYRRDLEDAGLGDGRHSFSVIIPGGLSPLIRHLIQVVGEADGCALPGSPFTLEAATGFDPALEHAVSAAVAAVALPEERERALAFLAAQTEKLLQDQAEAVSGHEARLLQRQLVRRGINPEGLQPESSAATKLRALVVDDLLPTSGRDAGSMAILSHMRALQELGYEVSFIAAEQLSPPPGASAELSALGIDCWQSPFYASVEEVLRRQPESFDVIYLHRISNASKYLALARRYSPKARILYSVADLHHIRLARQAKLEEEPRLLAESRRVRAAEFIAASAANAVITHSTMEATWLRQSVPGANVHVVPWALPLQPGTRPWHERSGIAFIGSFYHAPNVDAARLLAQHIMPQVLRADPSIQCLLVGSNMPASLRRLAAPGVVPMGHVEDLHSIYERVRVVVAPLRYGAGVKGKVLESFAAGVPCVMSPIAAEGIELPPTLARLIGANAAQIAAHLVRVHGNQSEFEAVSAAGLAFIRASYSEESVLAALRLVIEGRRAPGTVAASPVSAVIGPSRRV